MLSKDVINKAYEVLREACENNFQLKASIPARPDHDHDLLISDALTQAEKRTDALNIAIAGLNEWQKSIVSEGRPGSSHNPASDYLDKIRNLVGDIND